MQHNFFHISTKERRKKVAKKEERKSLPLPPPTNGQLFSGRDTILQIAY
jgi:hypothetical protein